MAIRYFASQGKNFTLTGLYGPQAARITIRQLATMTAGVNDLYATLHALTAASDTLFDTPVFACFRLTL